MIKHRINNWLLIAILLEIVSVLYALVPTIIAYSIILNQYNSNNSNNNLRISPSIISTSTVSTNVAVPANTTAVGASSIREKLKTSTKLNRTAATAEPSGMSASSSSSQQQHSPNYSAVTVGGISTSYDIHTGAVNNSSGSHNKQTADADTSTASAQSSSRRIYLLIPVFVLMHLYIIALIPI